MEDRDKLGRFKKGMVSWNTGKKGIWFPGSEKGWFKKKDPKEVNYWHSHKLARDTYGGQLECFIKQIENCSKRLEIHHIDGNAWNNNQENLVCLCSRHHDLVELKYIDLKKPCKVDCHVFPSGRIIYPKNKQYKNIKNHRNIP